MTSFSLSHLPEEILISIFQFSCSKPQDIDVLRSVCNTIRTIVNKNEKLLWQYIPLTTVSLSYGVVLLKHFDNIQAFSSKRYENIKYWHKNYNNLIPNSPIESKSQLQHIQKYVNKKKKSIKWKNALLLSLRKNFKDIETATLILIFLFFSLFMFVKTLFMMGFIDPIHINKVFWPAHLAYVCIGVIPVTQLFELFMMKRKHRKYTNVLFILIIWTASWAYWTLIFTKIILYILQQEYYSWLTVLSPLYMIPLTGSFFGFISIAVEFNPLRIRIENLFNHQNEKELVLKSIVPASAITFLWAALWLDGYVSHHKGWIFIIPILEKIAGIYVIYKNRDESSYNWIIWIALFASLVWMEIFVSIGYAGIGFFVLDITLCTVLAYLIMKARQLYFS